MPIKRRKRARQEATKGRLITEIVQPGANTGRDSADGHSITLSGKGVFHQSTTFRIPVQFLMTSEDGLPSGLLEITADWQFGQEWVIGRFPEGVMHLEVCGVHFLGRVVGVRKPDGALLLPAGSFFRAMAHEMSAV